MVKNPPANEGDIRDLSSTPGQEGPLEAGMALQYPCLENPMDREAGGLQSTELPRVRHD